MTIKFARDLYENGRAHALSADLLYRAAVAHAEAEHIEDPERFAFNGTFSLSIHYLVGLGFELLLKSAYVARGGKADNACLRNAIGHDLVNALEAAERQGFRSQAEHLREIINLMREPYIAHYFRYDRPRQMALPDVVQVAQTFEILDAEINALLPE